MFSCRLGNEQETALSIIDPVQIHMELIGNSSYPRGSGLLDAFNSEDFPPILEVIIKAWIKLYSVENTSRDIFVSKDSIEDSQVVFSWNGKEWSRQKMSLVMKEWFMGYVAEINSGGKKWADGVR